MTVQTTETAGISIEAVAALARAVADAGSRHTLAEGPADALATLVLKTFVAETAEQQQALELAGEALAAALHETSPAAEVVRLAAGIIGAPVALLWQRSADGELELAASYGIDAGHHVR